MAKKKFGKGSGSLSEKDNRKLKAFVASFFTIIGFLIAIILWKEDKYVMYYAKQGIVLFIGQLIVGAVSSIYSLRWFSSLLWIFWVVLWVLTWVNALSGKEKNTFIITDLSEKINL